MADVTGDGAKPGGGLEPGTTFRGTYAIVRKLSGGGMGAVYECVHRTTRKHRALKVMLPQLVEQPGLRERFELEARVTADIESDHVVETFDAGVDEATGVPFLVMELLRGEDLDAQLRARGPLAAEEAVDLLGQAAHALDKTHAAGIVQRDLKPQNLFVTTRDDGTPRLKVLDFGIAKVVAERERASQHTATLGTPLYMAPEQIEGQGIGPATDLYALGHVAYTLLVGEAYWEEENQASHSHWGTWKEIMAGVREPASLRAGRGGVTLPVAFDAWFTKATAAAARDRFASAGATPAASSAKPAPNSNPPFTVDASGNKHAKPECL
jgi:serine/threonine-protein kinase